jgi:murein DD-endopeptidase MepM/ murein hydrolase activator NlpD
MRRLTVLPLLAAVAVVGLAACRPAPAPAPARGAIKCPVTGPVSFTDDWHAPRAGGKLHEGNDVLAPRGTPSVAVVSGTVRHRHGPVSGLAVWLDGDDGTQYFYAHFMLWRTGERRVKAGETIGAVGNAGDAGGGPTHVHFEIHPGGGTPVNPYPSLVVACTNRR